MQLSVSVVAWAFLRAAVGVALGVLAVVGLASLLAPGTVGLAPAWQVDQARSAATQQAQQEYYRGIYDSCVLVFQSIDGCLEAARSTFEHDWYGQPSDGWAWPLPAPRMPDGSAQQR